MWCIPGSKINSFQNMTFQKKAVSFAIMPLIVEVKLSISFLYITVSKQDKFNFKLEALGERRPPPLVNAQQYVHVYFTRARTVTAAVACAETHFNRAFRLCRPECHQNLISSYLSPPPPDISSKFDQNPLTTFSVILRTNKQTNQQTNATFGSAGGGNHCN